MANNDFVVVSPLDDELGVDFGSVRLIDGTSGVQIGATITGNGAGDLTEAYVAASPNGDFYVLGLNRVDNNALGDSGLVRLIAQ
jgi:hypothetical protein